MLVELRKLYDLGFSLIPIEPGGKRPLGPWLGYQEIRRTWEMIVEEHREGMNWGVVCGRISDLVVVDVDPRNGGDPDQMLLELTEATQSPHPTLTVQTGGGGVHYYFKLEGKALASVPSWRQGVDLQAEGKYVVAPMSVHPSGERYLIMHQGPILPAPSILWTPRHHSTTPTATPAPTPANSDPHPWIAETLAKPGNVPNGEQENTLTRLAWYLSGQLPRDITQGILRHWVTKLWPHQPGWPWAWEDVDVRVERAYEKRAKQGKLDVSGLQRSPNPLPPPGDEDLPPLWDLVRSAREITEAQGTDIPWIIEGLLAPGCLVEVLGSPKAGKSTWVCGAVKCILEGIPWLDRPTQQKRVLYVTEQGDASFRKTLERGKLTQADDLFVLTPNHLHGREWDDAVTQILETAIKYDCQVVVIDTLARLARLAGDEENSSGVAMRVLRPFQEAKVKDLCVVFVRHGRKSGGTINEMGRGSNAYSGEMDVVIGLKCASTKDYRQMEVSGRLDEPIDCTLKYVDGTYVVTTDPVKEMEQQEGEGAKEALLERLSDGEWHVVNTLTWVGLGSKKALRLLKEMEHDGLVQHRPGKQVGRRRTNEFRLAPKLNVEGL